MLKTIFAPHPLSRVISSALEYFFHANLIITSSGQAAVSTVRINMVSGDMEVFFNTFVVANLKTFAVLPTFLHVTLDILDHRHERSSEDLGKVGHAIQVTTS